jgi:hypothetical protein
MPEKVPDTFSSPTLKTTPAVASGLADRMWSVEELLQRTSE